VADETTSGVEEYLLETIENVDKITECLTDGKQILTDKEVIKSVYRNIHTIKGGAGLFGSRQVCLVSHAMEACLDPIKYQGAVPTARLVDVLCDGLDLIRELVRDLQNTGVETDRSEALEVLLPAIVEATTEMLGDKQPYVKDTRTVPNHVEKITSMDVEDILDWGFPDFMNGLPPVPNPESEVMTGDTDSAGLNRDEKQAFSQYTNKNDREVRVNRSTEKESASNETIRVHVDVLDKLMNLTGELVLIRNQMVQNTAEKTNDIQEFSQRLNLLTTELQTEVMKTRMQPVSNVLNKFHRIVRDISRNMGKSIEFKLEGAETELDRGLIESVKDPLVHIVRNAIDHGFELPAERVAANKPEVGCLRIRAFHEGGQVVIEVCDDGRGMSRDQLAEKALAKNIVTPEKLEKMSDQDVFQLAFESGLSTAKKVTDVSGRGVGMEVVKSNLERIGGSVELSSSVGAGTTVRLKIPLTLVIVPALIVESSNQRFAIPQVKLVELVRVDGEQGTGIELLQGKPVYRLRGDLLPLVSLAEIFNTVVENAAEAKTTDAGAVNIVVLRSDAGDFGLIVDKIVDSTDVVVKPLASFLKNLGVFSGATVMGNGSVALTLDVMGLSKRANLVSSVEESERSAMTTQSQQMNSESMEYLLFDIGAKSRFAIPLCLVKRLEEFPISEIEHAGDQSVICYRDSILPIISLSDVLGIEPTKPDANLDEMMSIIVFEKGERSFGIRVARILDVLTVDCDVDMAVKDRPQVMGSLLWENEVIVVIDAFKVIEKISTPATDATAVSIDKGSHTERKRRQHKILFAEDNPFFRQQVTSILEAVGYCVKTEINGKEAFDRLHGSDKFSLLLSDIEMPVMDGLELVRSVRSDKELARLPVIALSTKARKRDIAEGVEAGFDQHLEKLKADTLIATLDNILGIDEEAA
jgi:two-component system chemotaxis sensor kinase CheA